MYLTETMVDVLHTIRRKESLLNNRRLNVNADQLGPALIKLYYRTSNLEIRSLIKEFMNLAGAVWLRKLYMRDASVIKSTKERFDTFRYR